MEMLSNATYIGKELPDLEVPAQLRARIESMNDTLVGTKHDLVNEPTLVCRMFRLERQTKEEALEQWHVLRRLEPGAVYRIGNSYPPSGGVPRPAYRVVSAGLGE